MAMVWSVTRGWHEDGKPTGVARYTSGPTRFAGGGRRPLRSIPRRSVRNVLGARGTLRGSGRPVAAPAATGAGSPLIEDPVEEGMGNGTPMPLSADDQQAQDAIDAEMTAAELGAMDRGNMMRGSVPFLIGGVILIGGAYWMYKR